MTVPPLLISGTAGPALIRFREYRHYTLTIPAFSVRKHVVLRHICNKIRRAKPSEKAAFKEEAKAVTKKLNPLREQLKNLQRILDKSDYVYTMLETERRLERQIGRSRDYER